MASNFLPRELTPNIADAGGEQIIHGTGDKVNDYRQQIGYWLSGAYEEAKFDMNQNDDIRRGCQYIEYITGKQWPGARPSYRTSPVNNRIWRLVWELVATLTDIRPVFEIKATNPDYDKHANMINKVTRAWWTESNCESSLAMIILYSILCTGYGKLQWNPELRGGEGDFEILYLGPTEVLPLKPTTDLQSSQMVILEQAKPLSWFRRKFPLVGSMVKADMDLSRYSLPSQAPGHIPQVLFEVLSPQMQRMVGRPEKSFQTVFPVARYREFWFKDWTVNASNVPVVMGDPTTNWSYIAQPNELLYPRGRVICTGGEKNYVVYDGPNPYWHGMYPFEALRLNAVPWQFLGVSELRPLIPLQDIINNTLAGILDMIKKAVNPGFLAPKNAFSDAHLNSIDWSMPGAKGVYSALSPHQPQFVPQPQLPSFVLQVLLMAAREMDQSSGIAAVDEAVRKNQVPSGDTLDQIKDSKQTPLRLKGKNIEGFLRTLGQQTISNVFQFYSMKRRMFMVGKEALTFEDFDWNPGSVIPQGTKPEEFARRFVFLIQSGSLLNINRVERAATLQRLRMMKDIDRRTLIEGLDMGINIPEVEMRLKKEAMDQADTAAKQRTILMAAQAMLQQQQNPFAQMIVKLLSSDQNPPEGTAQLTNA